MTPRPSIALSLCSEVADQWQAFRQAMQSSVAEVRQAAEEELEETMRRFVALVRKAERQARVPESQAA